MAALIRSPQLAKDSRRVPANPRAQDAAMSSASPDEPHGVEADSTERTTTVGLSDDLVNEIADEQGDDREISILRARLAQIEELADQRMAELSVLRKRIVAEEQRASESGYASGYAEGKADGKQAAAESLRSLNDVVSNLQKSTAEFLNAQEDLVFEVVLAAVGKILGEAFTSVDGTRAIVRQVITKVRDEAQLVVRVSPVDHRLLEQQNRSNGRKKRMQNWTLVADEQVQLGGCILETPRGNLDGRLETQLDALKETLLRVRQGRDNDGRGSD